MICPHRVEIECHSKAGCEGCPIAEDNAVEVEQSPQKAAGEESNSTPLLNAISDVLGGMIADAKKRHDSSEWPKKFLHAHEGIGLMQAVEVIEKLRKEYGI